MKLPATNQFRTLNCSNLSASSGPSLVYILTVTVIVLIMLSVIVQIVTDPITPLFNIAN